MLQGRESRRVGITREGWHGHEGGARWRASKLTDTSSGTTQVSLQSTTQSGDRYYVKRTKQPEIVTQRAMSLLSLLDLSSEEAPVPAWFGGKHAQQAMGRGCRHRVKSVSGEDREAMRCDKKDRAMQTQCRGLCYAAVPFPAS